MDVYFWLMINVSWFDAILYCNWLSSREGRKPCYERTGEEINVWRCDFAADGYRLPTEAEWEYASRAGSTSEFCHGSDEDLLPHYAWFVVNAQSRTWPGGAKLPSAFGLFDMHGNVWEWCCDWHGNYGPQAVSDPTGIAAGSARVVRGGAVNSYASLCRCACRVHYPPLWRVGPYGFRVLCGNQEIGSPRRARSSTGCGRTKACSIPTSSVPMPTARAADSQTSHS